MTTKGTNLKITTVSGGPKVGDTITVPAIDAAFLSSLTIAELAAARSRIDEAIAARRTDLAAQLSQVDALIGAGKTHKTSGTKRSPLLGAKVAPKYRGPNGETWAGRGAHPKWLAELIVGGRSIDEFRL